MQKSKRKLLQIAAVTAVAVTAAPVIASMKKVLPPLTEKTPGGLTAKRWAMVIDTRNLSEEQIQKMQDACHIAHNVPNITEYPKQEVKWIWADSFNHTFTKHLPDKVKDAKYPLLCNHCENPTCVRVCPTKATFKNSSGIVVMDYHRCIGCRYCMAACPYGARSFNFMDPRPYLDDKTLNRKFPTRMRGVVEKCTFCDERLAQGLLPSCVEASDGNVIFGDLNDSNSNVNQALRENFAIRRNLSDGNGPSVFYII